MPRGAVGVRADQVRGQHAAQQRGAQRQLAEDLVAGEGQVQVEDDLQRVLAAGLRAVDAPVLLHAVVLHRLLLVRRRVQLLRLTPLPYAHHHALVVHVVLDVVHERRARREQRVALLADSDRGDVGDVGDATDVGEPGACGEAEVEEGAVGELSERGEKGREGGRLASACVASDTEEAARLPLT